MSNGFFSFTDVNWLLLFVVDLLVLLMIILLRFVSVMCLGNFQIIFGCFEFRAHQLSCWISFSLANNHHKWCKNKYENNLVMRTTSINKTGFDTFPSTNFVHLFVLSFQIWLKINCNCQLVFIRKSLQDYLSLDVLFMLIKSAMNLVLLRKSRENHDLIPCPISITTHQLWWIFHCSRNF